MVGKITRTPEGLALVLSPELLTQLQIDADTEFEITTAGPSLIATPVMTADRRARFAEALQQANTQYGDALKRLAE